METRARLMFVDAGFPEPEVNAPLTDAAGEWIAEGDLVWHRQRLVGEYQGEQHADRRRRSADAFRRGLVEATTGGSGSCGRRTCTAARGGGGP